jgi:hypothetical protein
MQTTLTLAPRPFFAEARAYCDECGISDIDEAERVRLSMAHRELRARMEPWNKMAARVLAYHMPGPEFDAEVQRLQGQLREIQLQHALELGLDLLAV